MSSLKPPTKYDVAEFLNHKCGIINKKTTKLTPILTSVKKGFIQITIPNNKNVNSIHCDDNITNQEYKFKNTFNGISKMIQWGYKQLE